LEELASGIFEPIRGLDGCACVNGKWEFSQLSISCCTAIRPNLFANE
jgi:hypothetical protein